MGLKLKRQRKRVDGQLVYVYKLDREVLDDGSRQIILEAIERRSRMALIENSPDKQSTVLPIPNNIETKGEIEHSDLELDEKSTVLPVPINIEPEAQIEHPDLEVDGKSTVLPVDHNIETKGEIEHLELEVELQTSGPLAANYIDSDARVKPSEIQADLKKHFARIYDSPEAIEQLALMLSPIDSPEALQDLNKCEFYDRERFNKAAKLLPKLSAT